MSLKGTIEIFVHFNQFRNIDLFHQGVYQLKTYIYLKEEYAQPYMTVEEKRLGNVFKQNQEYIAQQSKLVDNYYYSKAFIVKYCEQQIDLNEGCIFRIEMNAYPSLDQDNLYCMIELLYCELSVLTQENFKNDKLPLYQKTVAKFQSKLHNVHMIREFVPCTFDEMHFCYLKIMFHSILVDFKFHQHYETFEQFFAKITNNFQIPLILEFFQGYNKILNMQSEQFNEYYQSIIKECIDDIHIKNKFMQIKQIKSFIPMDLSKYIDKINSKTEQEELCNQLMIDLKQFSSHIFLLWYQFIEAFNYMIRPLNQKLQIDYLSKIKERWGESIFQNVQTVTDMSLLESQTGKSHRSVAKQIRNNNYYQALEPLNIEDIDLFPLAKIHPIVFKDVSQTKQMQRPKIKGLHLFVFVHGYQGNSNDMRLWKNNMLVRYPEHLCLLSQANEENTECDILLMGERLALEIKRWIKEWCPKDNFSKISFVCHSLGGLIVRAALPNLSKYQNRFYSYITLGSPHLGYANSNSKVVDTGLWFIRKWKKCICLNQLTLNDNSDYMKTCLYRLSQLEGLGWFQNIVLVSSYQDTYSPFESARIQRPSQKMGNSEKSKILNLMIDNLMGNLKQSKLERLDINYELPGKNLDSFIGRAAHIAFLDNSALIKLAIYSFEEWFE